jgi:cytidylate kinase
MKKIIITIDGYSSCGKSTLAKALAAQLNFVFIDSGAMYRAITLYFLRNHIDWNNPSEVKNAIENITLEFSYNKENGSCEMFLNDENVEWLIRDMLVAENVSEVAAVKEVREFAIAEQRKMGKGKGIVMDGRDIGSTVFPKAEFKIFLIADPAIRVERRFREMLEKNPNITIDEVKANLEMRDYIDSNREFSPLRKAKDAVELDNSNLTIEDQMKIALKLAKGKIQD